ncbi:hypothetical protein A3C57_02440 [Candidatus Nomurabacteria bacterium RIFCSPHIGHO2_02_FULL_33_12]|uniref:Uncharacterized protein n=1 Tax=Candidatus Nomurabacteria bacterium RIFCSPLOWO2_01_FULL_33_17 TaxID=1801764 RepID=A0A1F6WMV1_9BACT|nr:MAG: hypothetical protein A3C57_02440 [Candidatus Nomurabacteria bacterium RIFCSPHIGHO2_02_FULL_33_12]OGI83210.1 MAG: hypothetical protein A2903_00830 [Candidatus Nomurabacteria bacterium RIFCSPLOWO2_01_FULL_33_17]
MEENYTIKSKFEKIGLLAISYSVGLSLVFFIPFLPFSLVFGKGILLTFGAFLGIIFYILDCIACGRFILPASKTYIFFAITIFLAFITSFFVPNTVNSFIGTGFDFGTISTLLIAFVYFFLFSIWTRAIDFTKHISKTFYITCCIAILFVILEIIFGITKLVPNMFLGISGSNLVGSFNDFAIILGAFVFVNSLVIENKFLRKPVKIGAILILILSLILLFIINYVFIWKLIGLFGLSMLIYRLMPRNFNIENSENTKRKFSVIGFILIICAFVGIIGSNSIANLTAQRPLYFINNESRLTLASSISVIKNTYYKHPFIGAGLNRFNLAWESSKSQILGGKFLSSPYWNISFTHGFGIFFTLIATLGVFAGIVFIYFMILICKKIISLFGKNLSSTGKSNTLFIYSTLSLYSLVIFLFDTPNTAIFIVIFAFWGILYSYIDNLKNLNNKVFSFIHDSRYSFFSIFSLMILLILNLYGGYYMSRSFYANYLVNKASLMTANSLGIDMGESYIKKALSIHKLDSYARALSNVEVLKIISIINDTSKPQEQLRSLLTETINSAAESAKLSVGMDPSNYQNYLSILRVQEVLISFGNKDVYNDAIAISNKVLTLNPNNPGVIMRQAKIAVSAGAYEDANIFIDQVVSINPYYIDAYILRSQIHVTLGQTDLAFNILDQGILLNPQSGDLMYQKGLLFISIGDYSNAAEAFEKARRLSPNKLNIYSSLAGSYEKIGNKQAVIDTLESAKKYVNNPDEINSLIARVKNGESIFNTASVTTDEKDLKNE